MNVLLLAHIPSRSTITTYQDVPRNYRRHIGSPYGKYDILPYANYWETGLKDAAYRAFLRKGYADPSLKDQIVNAPVVGLRNRQTTPFGDITVLARGQLYFSAGGFLFIEDENLYDCDECENVGKQSYHNHGQIVALWTVKRLRHHDNSGFYRYETQYLISPTSNNNYLKPNGAFDYDIPGYVFVLKNSETESNNYKYLQPTPAWYNEEASKYLSSKAGRRYLPPDTTTTAFYYATSRPFYSRNDKEWYHHYDPDIIPAKNNVEMEIELYRKLLQSLKSVETTGSTPSTGHNFITRLTPTIPSSTAPVNMFTTSFRFPDATPFKPSPMYTKYSEPDPLYTTTTPTMTSTSSQPTTRLTTIGIATKSTIPLMTSKSSSQPSTRLTTEAMTAKSTTSKMFYPTPSLTTSSTTFKTTSTAKPSTESTVTASTPKILTTVLKIATEAVTPETVYPTSSQETLETEPTHLPDIKTSPQSLVANVTMKEFKSTQATFTPSTTPTTLTAAQRSSASKIITMSKIFSPTIVPVSKISMTSEPSTKTQNIVSSTLYPLTTKPISTTTKQITPTNRVKSTTSMEFDIFNIFDTPKSLKVMKHIENLEANKDDASEMVAKSQTLPLASSTRTTPYAEMNQASSVVLTILKNDITTIQPSTLKDTETEDIYNKPEYFSNERPTTEYPEETISYTLNMLDVNVNESERNIPGDSFEISNDGITTRMMPEEATTLEVTTNVVDKIPIEEASEATTKAFEVTNIPTTISSNEEEARTIITSMKGMPGKNTLKTLETNSESQNIETSTIPMTSQIESNTNYTQTTKKYEFSRLSVNTTPTPIIYTTPRVKKYKYTRIPKRKSTKNRKFDSASTVNPSNANIFKNTSKFNRFSLYTTSTTKKPEVHFKLDTTTSALHEEDINKTSTMNETQITIPETTVYEVESPETTNTPRFETEITEEFTQTRMISTETIPTSLPYAEEQTTKALIHDENYHFIKEISKNIAPNPTISTQRFNIAATPHSSEFDEIFGVFSKEATFYTTITSPVTKKMSKNNVNTEELQKELFGIVGRNSLEAEENHPTQIEETTTEATSSGKIIFDNFYEASTLPIITEETINNEETTPVTSTTLLVMESATELVKIDEDDESMLLTTTIPITQNTIQPEALTTECIVKTSINETMESKLEIAKIIAVQIVNTTKTDKRQAYKDDILKANVSQINVGDKNFLVYKAVVDEKVLPLNMTEKQTDLFNRLALSVVNHAKSIDYLNKRKQQQIRRKKVFKVKNRHKKKQGDKNLI